MANLLQTTQNDIEPIELADAEIRDDFGVAAGTFVKGEVVSWTAPKAIVKYVPATNAPLGILAEAVDASGGAVSNVTVWTKGLFDEDKLTYNTTADSTTAVYGPTLTTRDALRLVGIRTAKTYSIDNQQS